MAIAVSVAGCGGPSLRVGEPAPEPVRSWGTSPPGAWATDAVDVADPAGGFVRVAAGLNDSGELLITTWGSSSCPRLPSSVEADASTVVVETRQFNFFSGNDCTTDASPTTSTVAVPPGVVVDRAIRVVIDGIAVTAHRV